MAIKLVLETELYGAAGSARLIFSCWQVSKLKVNLENQSIWDLGCIDDTLFASCLFELVHEVRSF